MPKQQSTDFIRVKSVLTPPAQSPGMLSTRINNIETNDKFLNRVFSNSLLTMTDKAVIELLYLYGLRVSELLSVLPTDVAESGHILIRGSKGSGNRFILSLYFKDFWQRNLKYSLPLSQYFSRFYFYRLFKKLGFYSKYGNNVNMSVTHYFRHQLVLSLQEQGFSKEMISEFIRHKSTKSIEYYVKPKRNKY